LEGLGLAGVQAESPCQQVSFTSGKHGELRTEPVQFLAMNELADRIARGPTARTLVTRDPLRRSQPSPIFAPPQSRKMMSQSAGRVGAETGSSTGVEAFHTAQQQE
jgi:hypothetical protein